MPRLLTVLFCIVSLCCQAQAGRGGDQQSKAYTQALAEYIKAIRKTGKADPDTLFIGKHQDFPVIKLPATIGRVPICVLTNEAADKKMAYRRSMVYINMVDPPENFLLVVFHVSLGKAGRPVYKPHHNCHIALRYDSRKQEYVLKDLWF